MTATDAMKVLSGDKPEVVPPWLRRITSAEFYSWCETHRPKKRNYFCRVCMLSLCKDCKGEHDRSKHEIAYKASHAASLRMEDLKLLWDVSGICPYIFNNKEVAFIQKKGTGISRSRSKTSITECESCRYALQWPSTQYCSVECKVECVLKTGGSGSIDHKAKRKLEMTLEETAHILLSFQKQARK